MMVFWFFDVNIINREVSNHLIEILSVLRIEDFRRSLKVEILEW